MTDIDQLNNVDNSADLRISVAEIWKIEQIKTDLEKAKEWEAKIDEANEKILKNREAEAKAILDAIYKTGQTVDMKIQNDPKNIKAMQTLLLLKTIWPDASLKWIRIAVDWNVNSLKNLFTNQDGSIDKWKAIDLLSMNIDANFNKMLTAICWISDDDISKYEEEKKKKAETSSIQKWETVDDNVDNLSDDNINWAVNQLKVVVKTELKGWKGSFNQMKQDLWESWLKAAKIIMYKYLKDNGEAWNLSPDFNNNNRWDVSAVVKAFQGFIMKQWWDNAKLIIESWKDDWKIWFNTFNVLKNVSILKDIKPEEKTPELKSNAESKEVWISEMPKTIPDFIKAFWKRDNNHLTYNQNLVLEDGWFNYVKIGNERYAIDDALDNGYIWKGIRTKLDGTERVLQIWNFNGEKFEWKELRENGDKKTEMIKRTREDNSVLTIRKFKWDYDENWDYKWPWRFSIREVVNWEESDTKRLSDEQLTELMKQHENVARVLEESIKAFGLTERQPSSVWRYNLNRIVNLILKDKDMQNALKQSDSKSTITWESICDSYITQNPFEDWLTPKVAVQRFLWLEYWMLSNPKHKINIWDMTESQRKDFENRKNNPKYERPLQWPRIQERLWELLKIYKKVKLSQ